MSFFAVKPEELGGRTPDIVLVTGDAYVDHPSFGISVIGHILEKEGYLCAMIARPDLKDPDCFRRFGKPNVGFLPARLDEKGYFTMLARVG